MYRASTIVLVLLRHIIVIVRSNFLSEFIESQRKLMHALNSSNHLGFNRWKYKFPHSFHYILSRLEKLVAILFSPTNKTTYMNEQERAFQHLDEQKQMNRRGKDKQLVKYYSPGLKKVYQHKLLEQRGLGFHTKWLK